MGALQVAALCLYADAINYGNCADTRELSEIFLPAALLTVCPQSERVIDEDQLLAIPASAYGMGGSTILWKNCSSLIKYQIVLQNVSKSPHLCRRYEHAACTYSYMQLL